MARLTLDFPEHQYCYATELTVRATDINAANHLSNEALVAMISEARARFFHAFGVTDEGNGDIGTIIADLATVYRAEAHVRDRLLFEIGVMDFNKYGGDLTFRITRPRDRTLVALAKCGFLFFDYKARKAVPMPAAFHSRFPNVNWIGQAGTA